MSLIFMWGMNMRLNMVESFPTNGCVLLVPILEVGVYLMAECLFYGWVPISWQSAYFMAECLLTGLFLCDRCETNFEEIMRLNNHMIREHMQPDSFWYVKCGNRYIDKCKLSSHNDKSELNNHISWTCTVRIFSI